MRTTKMATRSNIEEGLRELTGVHQCAAPGCLILLSHTQGKTTGRYKTCFQRPCVAWAENSARVEGLS